MALPAGATLQPIWPVISCAAFPQRFRELVPCGLHRWHGSFL